MAWTIELALKAIGFEDVPKEFKEVGRSAAEAGKAVNQLTKGLEKGADPERIKAAVAAVEQLRKNLLEEAEAERAGVAATENLKKAREEAAHAARIANSIVQAGVEAASEEGRAIAALINRQRELRKEIADVVAARLREKQALSVTSELKREITTLQQDIAAHRQGAAAVTALAQARRIEAAQARAGVAAEDAIGNEIAEQIRLYDRLQAELRQTMTARTGSGGSAGGFSSTVSAVQAVAGKALIAYGAIMTLKNGISTLTSAAVDSEAVMAQLRAGVESTGGAAGYSAKELADMASRLSEMAGVDDEVIAGGEAILLTFDRIKGGAFFDAMTDAMDLAARKGMDLDSAVQLIGKTYSGALDGAKKAGVLFTDAQEKQIKKLLEAGQVLEAQAQIHAAFQRAVGGSAAAARDTLGGALRAAQVEAGNLVEELAGGMAPVVRDLTERFIEWAKSAEAQKEMAEWGRLLGEAVHGAAEAVEILGPALRVVATEAKVLLSVGSNLLEFLGWLAGKIEIARDQYVGLARDAGLIKNPIVEATPAIEQSLSAQMDAVFALREEYGKLGQAAIDAARDQLSAMEGEAFAALAQAQKIGELLASREATRKKNAAIGAQKDPGPSDVDRDLMRQKAELEKHGANLNNIITRTSLRLTEHSAAVRKTAGETRGLSDAQKGAQESARRLLRDLEDSVRSQAKRTAAAKLSSDALKKETLAQEQAAKAEEIRQAFIKAGIPWTDKLTDYVYELVASLEKLKQQQGIWALMHQPLKPIVITRDLQVTASMADASPTAIEGRLLKLREAADAALRKLKAETEAFLGGQGALDAYNRGLQIQADIREVLGERTAENAAEWDKQADQLAKGLRARFEAELVTQIQWPEFSGGSLRKFGGELAAVVDGFKDGEVRAAAAAEAQRIYNETVRRSIPQQMEAWANLFQYLGDSLGGLFADVASMINSVQNVRGVASSMGGWSSAAGAFGGTFAAFAEAYKYADAIIQKHKSEKYGTTASTSRTGGVDVSSYNLSGSQSIQRQSLELAHAIQEGVRSLEEALRISITDLSAIEIKVRNDGKSVQAWVKGVYLGTFEDAASAIRAAAMEALKQGGKASGFSSIMRQGLDRFTAPDAEGLLKFLQQLRAVSDLSLSPLAVQLQASILELAELRKALNQLDQASADTIAAQKALTRAQLDLVAQAKEQLLGIDNAAANGLKNLAGFRNGMDDVSASIRANIESQIAAAQARLNALTRQETGLPNGGMGGQGVAGPNDNGIQVKDVVTLYMDSVVGAVDDEKTRLQAAIEAYKKQLGEIPTALSKEEVALGIFTSLEGYLRKSGKYGELIAKYERMRVDLQFKAIQMQLVALGAWEEWAQVWTDLRDEAMAQAGKGGGGAGGSGRDLKSERQSLRDELARIVTEAKGSLHLVFFDLDAQIKDLQKRAKDAKMPLADLAAAIAALQAGAKKQAQQQMDALAGIGTDFTRRLQDGLDFFKQLEELGRGKTGIPDWKRKVREDQFKDQMKGDFQNRLNEFNGISDPMLQITLNANKLRQELLALGEAGILSADQIAKAQADIAAGQEYQRQSAVTGIMDRLFGYLRESGKFAKEQKDLAVKKVQLEFALIKAQLVALGAWDQGTQEIFDAAKDAALKLAAGLKDAADKAAARAGAWYEAQAAAAEAWKTAAEAGRQAVDDWRRVVESVSNAAKAALTDESVTGLSQSEQLSAAEKAAKDLYARAMAGDAGAAGQLMAALNEWRKEGMESYGGGEGSQQIWQQYLQMTKDFLQTAPSLEGDIYKKAMDAALANDNQNTQQITTAVYNSAQEVVNAINRALGNLPGYADGGVVTRKTLAWVGERGPEIITPLSNVIPFVPPVPKTASGGGNAGNGEVAALLRELIGRVSALEAVVANTGGRTADNTEALAESFEKQRRKAESDRAFARRSA